MITKIPTTLGKVYSQYLVPLIVTIGALQIVGCSHLFFHPHNLRVLQPSDVGLSFTEEKIPFAEGEELYGWRLLTRKQPRALVLFLHGNGGNVSTHLGSVAWLPAREYEVVTVDYSGYGNSDGAASLDSVHRDVALLFTRYGVEARVRGIPFFVVGESLGGTLALYSVATAPEARRPHCVVAVSPFSSYRKIAREKVAELWLLFPFQWPLGFLVSDKFSPIDKMGHLTTSTLLLHGRNDLTVPAHHSTLLKEASTQGRLEGHSLITLFFHDGGHDGTLTVEPNQRVVFEFLESAACREPIR